MCVCACACRSTKMLAECGLLWDGGRTALGSASTQQTASSIKAQSGEDPDTLIKQKPLLLSAGAHLAFNLFTFSHCLPPRFILGPDTIVANRT